MIEDAVGIGGGDEVNNHKSRDKGCPKINVRKNYCMKEKDVDYKNEMYWWPVRGMMWWLEVEMKWILSKGVQEKTTWTEFWIEEYSENETNPGGTFILGIGGDS